MSATEEKIKLSVVIPALNEELTIGGCVKKAFEALLKTGVAGEVIVCDNGSSDRTRAAAEENGARVVTTPEKGYGHACIRGMQQARGEYLIMGDADDSYDFSEIDAFYRKLNEGYEIVIGNRYQGQIEKGAMPALHRYFGTPALTFAMNLFFKTKIGDTNCGMRALTKNAFLRMDLKSGGMEFATEMTVKASLLGLKLTEIPCNLYRDKRNRKSHLRPWADGWRHLRLILLYARQRVN